MSQTEFQAVLLVLGVLVFAALWWWLGRRNATREEPLPARLDPDLGRVNDPDAEPPAAEAAPMTEEPDPAEAVPERYERIVCLHVMARDGHHFAGRELVVAAERVSLVHGDRGIYHRYIDRHHADPPIFSMINRIQPGNFDLSNLDELKTPGVSFFMLLPGPLSALDAWERMLPAAQRFAELLEGRLLDAEENPLNRQRSAHLKDELRTWDREQAQREARNTVKSW
ncbi:MAG: cell division protein ZipA [Xanthomonadales bacterium]|jgi:cell division protein ZipA|nr:cell division protein ZipA [Xanthomonadales bacterium]